jgi:hypothetical protein
MPLAAGADEAGTAAGAQRVLGVAKGARNRFSALSG